MDEERKSTGRAGDELATLGLNDVPPAWRDKLVGLYLQLQSSVDAKPWELLRELAQEEAIVGILEHTHEPQAAGHARALRAAIHQVRRDVVAQLR